MASSSYQKLLEEFFDAARNDDVATLRRILPKISNGNDPVNATDADGDTALHIAAREGSDEAVSYLLENGADIDITNDEGETAREVADNNGNDSIVDLIDGHEPSEEDEEPTQEDLINDLVSAAGENKNLDDVKKILPQIKEGIDAKDDGGDTALCAAAVQGNLDIVKYLLENKANIATKNTDGETALHAAAREGNADVVKYLLAVGADTTALDDSDETACDKARDNGHDDIVALLQEWSLLGSSKLVHIESSETFGHKMTEVFNFESRERVTLIEKLSGGNEIALPVISFDDLHEETLRKAFNKFSELGGRADESFVFHARVRIKKTNQLPGQK